jgi:hypothetical protein
MKKKVLIIFKYPHAWNEHVINRFLIYYDTEFLYINNFKNKNFTEIVDHINHLIKSKSIEIVVFDVDYFKFINFFFIEKINSNKKILITGDDFEFHEFHSVTASASDLVLSQCPLSVLKYKEKGYEAYLSNMEFSNISKNNVDKKEIDVLFYGHITPDRKSILDYIVKEGINLKNVGHEEKVTGVPKEELLKLISKSKIVLELSKSRTSFVRNYASESIYKFFYLYKGKIIVAGLRGAACVSEYSPGTELLYSKDEVPTFFTKEECVKILKRLLNNNELLKKYTNKFTSKVHNLYEDKKNFEPIYNAIEKLIHRRVKLIKIPYWYLRISAKQILLRNLKLSNLIEGIFQFGIIFKMIKNSSLLTKFLIVSESIINTLWYSFIFTLKSKK